MQLKVLRPAADDDSFDMNFYRNNFSKQTIKILILIPIIPRNMFKLHAKKSTLNLSRWHLSFLLC